MAGIQHAHQYNISPYVLADAEFDWKPGGNWYVGVRGQCLLRREQPEYPSGLASAVSDVPRSVTAKIVWTFR